ncbi:MAG: hypothetical protein EA353_02690 [Puniceicoccaceae bacterium]|nr:MAG: hypothetical protein EA353_02690 [Puniceicoccaceae bacterium]
MSFQLIIRNRAQCDIAEILEDYEEKENGLGAYFLLCLDASLEALSRYPTAPRIIKHEYRRFFVKKFPISIYYIVREDKIYIDVIEPMMRNPERLNEKLKG